MRLSRRMPLFAALRAGGRKHSLLRATNVSKLAKALWSAGFPASCDPLIGSEQAIVCPIGAFHGLIGELRLLISCRDQTRLP
jgi:hypothetical protein